VCSTGARWRREDANAHHRNHGSISIAPTLVARGKQQRHDALYWEFHSQGSSPAVRIGRWKGIRRNAAKQPNAPIELYDLERDLGETTNVAAANPDLVRRVEGIIKSAHAPAVVPRWNFTGTNVQHSQVEPSR
jgi:hypothetical protein